MKNTLSSRINGISTNINLIRFIMAICVIICHSYYIAENKVDLVAQYTGEKINLGGIAVAVFFFLSGFYSEKSLDKTTPFQFMKKRCVRLFPQLWITIILSIFVLGAIATTIPITKYFLQLDTYKYLLNAVLVPIHNLPGVFQHNIYGATVNGSLWTLPVEFMAYCIEALVVYISVDRYSNDKIRDILHLLEIVVAVFLMGCFIYIGNDFLVTVVRPYIAFVLGIVAYRYAEKIILDVRISLIITICSCLLANTDLVHIIVVLFLPYVVLSVGLGCQQIKLKGRIWQSSYEIYLVAWPIQQIICSLNGGEMSVILNMVYSVLCSVIAGYALMMITENVIKYR